MNDRGKSDRPIVLQKLANKGGVKVETSLAESVEGRGLAKGNLIQQNRCRTQCRDILQSALNQVRGVAYRERETQFTALWHHVYNVDRLHEAYQNMRREAAAGVDGETWQHKGSRSFLAIRRVYG